MSIRPASALALSAAFGCTFEIGPVSDTAATDPTTDTTTTTTSDPSATTGDLPTTTATTTATDPGTSSTGDTAGEPLWCHGFDPELTGLTVANEAGVSIVNGTPLTAVCGGQGVLMIPVYPHFGGFTPVSTTVPIDLILDVDDFNLGPTGHFADLTGLTHTVDCTGDDPYYSGSYDFIPIFPPDGLADINAINGKMGHLHLTLHTPDGDLPFDADIILEANIEACGYFGFTDYDDDTGTGTGTDTDTGTDTGTSTG